MISSDINNAVNILQQEGVVAIPTETVYGLAADITLPKAVDKIFALKGRPTNHPLIVHIGDKSDLFIYGKNIPDYAKIVIDHFWPGPLTLIVYKSDLVNLNVTGGQDTVGIRMPSHPLALELIQKLGHPVAAPSANKFGHISPTTAEHVLDEFGDDVNVLNGGPCAIGIESTIIDATDPHNYTILREGMITASMIEKVLADYRDKHKNNAEKLIPTLIPAFKTDGNIHTEIKQEKRVPGNLKKHYAPKKPLVLFKNLSELAQIITDSQDLSICILALSTLQLFSPDMIIYPMPTSPQKYASQLYHQLRKADSSTADIIAVEMPPQIEEWIAVIDRLTRASY